MEKNRPQSYANRFLAVSTKLERLFFRLAVFGFLGILISQLLLSNDSLRNLISRVDVLEGQQLYDSQQAGSRPTGARELTVKRIGEQHKGPSAIKINGLIVAQLSGSEVTIKVSHGDVLEIESQHEEAVAEYEIDHNDPAITTPAPGTVVESSQGHSAVIGPVMFHK